MSTTFCLNDQISLKICAAANTVAGDSMARNHIFIGAEHTFAAAQKMKCSSSDLTEQSSILRREVDRFISEIKTAVQR